jgi:hypothetical protein
VFDARARFSQLVSKLFDPRQQSPGTLDTAICSLPLSVSWLSIRPSRCAGRHCARTRCSRDQLASIRPPKYVLSVPKSSRKKRWPKRVSQPAQTQQMCKLTLGVVQRKFRPLQHKQRVARNPLGKRSAGSEQFIASFENVVDKPRLLRFFGVKKVTGKCGLEFLVSAQRIPKESAQGRRKGM